MHAEAPTQSRHAWRRAVHLLAWTLGGIAVVLVIFVAWLQSPPGRRFATQRLIATLADRQIDVSIRQLSYNLFSLSVDVSDLRVRALGKGDVPTFATVARGHLDVSLLALLRGRYEVQAGSIDGLDVRYVVDAQGGDNLPRPLTGSSSSGEPLDYFIRQLSLSDAQLQYENRAQSIGGSLSIQSLTVEGERLTNRHHVMLTAQTGEVRYEDRVMALRAVRGGADLGRDDVTFDNLQIMGSGVDATLTGSLRDFAEPDANLALRLTADTARVAALAGLTEPVGGIATIDARLVGPVAAGTVTAQVRSSDLQYRTFANIRLDAQGQFDLATRATRVGALSVDSPYGRVSGSGAVVSSPDDRSALDLQLTNVNASRLMREMSMPYAVGSTIDGDASIEWPGLAYMNTTGNASFRLTALPGARGVVPVSGRVDVTARNGAGRALLTNVRAAGVQIDGPLTLNREEALGGQLHTTVADLGRTAAAAERLLGRAPGTFTPTRISGGATGEVSLGGTLDGPRADARIVVPALRLGEAAPAAVTISGRYRPDAIEIQSADVAWQDARAHVDGNIGLSGAQPIALRATAASIRINQVLSAFERDASKASGQLSMDATVHGSLARPVGNVSLRGEGLAAYGEQLGVLNGTATLDGRQVIVESMSLDKPQPDGNGQVTARGRYDLDRRTYTVDIASSNVHLLNLELPTGERLTGDVNLTASGTGSVEQPAAEVELMLDALEVGTRALGRVAVTSRVAGTAATIHATAAQFDATLDATIGTERPYPTMLDLQFDGTNLDRLPLALNTPLTGTVRARIEAVGDLVQPTAGSATASIDQFTGTWNGHPFSVDGPAMVRYAGERVQVGQLMLRAEDSTLSVAGEFPVTERAGDGTLSIDAHANLATLVRYAPAGTEVAGDGTLTLKGTILGRIEGTTPVVSPDLELAVDDGLLLSPAIEPGISNLTVRGHIGEGQAAIDQLTAQWGAAGLKLMAVLPFNILPDLPVKLPHGAGPASITASLQDLDPAAIPGVPPAVSGLISMEANATTTSVNLDDLSGEIVFPDLNLRFEELTMAQSQPSTIRLANGAATIERLDLSGSIGNLQASGSVGLAGRRPVDVQMSGQLQVGVISVLVDNVQAEGLSRFEMAGTGTLTNPEISGFIDLEDGNVVVDEPNVAAAGIWARVDFQGGEAILSQLTAELNGGSLTGWGSVALGGGGIRNVDVGLGIYDFAFDAPLDLRSLSHSDLRITTQDDLFLISGDVVIDEAGLTGDVNFDTGLLAAINARQTLDLTEQRNATLEKVRLDVGVTTATPVLIENNLARAEADVDVRVLGTPYEPGLAGNLTLLEGGQVMLNERTYQVERGVITFIDERDITPSFDLRLTTAAGGYDIVVSVNGPLNKTETTLTSTPTLPEPDIMAVLVTGRTLDQMRGEEYEVAREQVLSYLTGRLGSTLGRGLQRATGLSTVRVEPNLIANEADPTARLTLGQELSDDLELIYSTDLTNSNDQIWMLRYALTRRFQTRGVRQADNSYRFDFSHDLRFGGVPEPRRIARERPLVAQVVVDSDAGIPEAELRELLGVEVGDEFDFFQARDGAQKVEQRLRDQGHLQARVRLRRMIQPGGVRLALNVTQGPTVDLRITGVTPPESVADEVRRQWSRGVFDLQRADDGREVIRAWLLESGFLQSMIEPAIEDLAADHRQVTFSVESGPHYGETVLAFDGASAVSADTLEDIVHSQGLDQQVYTDPLVVTELLQRYYRDQGYLDAQIDTPRYEYTGSVARIVMDVREGPLFTVRNLQTSGNTALDRAALLPAIPLQPGDPFLPFAAENALQGLRDLYWKQGYNDVRPDYNLTILPGGRVDVTFTLDEGAQTVVSDIAVEGRQKTSDRLVLGELEVKTGEPLDLAALGRSRQNLYKSGAFSLVDFRRTDASSASRTAGSTDGAITSRLRPVDLTVTVREVQPIQMRYGVSYDTERAAGAVFDVAAHNIIGKARVFGLQSRYDRQVREARLYLSQPSLLRTPFQTTVALYTRSERNPATEVADAFDIDRRGASIQLERKLRDLYIWNYGFRYEKVRTNNEKAAGLPSATVSPLTMTLSRDGRDDVLDATKGSFASQALVFSPAWLNADQPFLKYFGQYFRYIALQPERRERFTNEIIRPRFVFASATRVGVARGLGGAVPMSERFFAGGSTSMRGFAQNAVGPVDATHVPSGGNAMLILNNEVRFPLVKWFDGVGFIDVGNVFDQVADFSFTDLRKAAGVGLRVRTPWFLIRGDYGVPLDRRAGESASRFFFSIGQAF